MRTLKVWISIGYSIGEPKEHKGEVTEEQLVTAARDYFWSREDRPKHVKPFTSLRLDDRFIRKLLGLENISGTAVTYQAEPKFITVTEIGHFWFCVQWMRELKRPGDEASGFAFMYNNSQIGVNRWGHFPVPAECTIDQTNGNLTVENYKGNELFYPAFVEPWPEPMARPQCAPSLGILNRLLKAEDENPLTMLACAGHQPCKGAAKQVINALKEAQKLLIHDPVRR